MKPTTSIHGAFYKNYADLVAQTSLSDALLNSVSNSFDFLDSIPEEKGNYRYAEGKWSIKELLQHIIDTERIFSYRALAIGRGDQTALPGYDENQYAENCLADLRSLDSLVKELEQVRISAIEIDKIDQMITLNELYGKETCDIELE